MVSVAVLLILLIKPKIKERYERRAKTKKNLSIAFN